MYIYSSPNTKPNPVTFSHRVNKKPSVKTLFTAYFMYYKGTQRHGLSY